MISYLQNGQLKAVLGGSGGIKILTTVAQVLLRLIAGHDPFTAVSLPRVHHRVSCFIEVQASKMYCLDHSRIVCHLESHPFEV